MYLDPGDQYHIGAGLDRIDSRSQGQSTGGAGAFDPTERGIEETFMCGCGHCPEVALLREQLANEVTDIATIDDGRIDTYIFTGTKSDVMK